MLATAFAKTSVKSGTIDLIRALYDTPSSSGKTVNVNTAIQVAAVFACMRVLGEGVAQVPFKMMLENGNTRLPAKTHSLYELLANQPNPWQTSFEYREMLVWHAGLTGNHYSFINRSSRGEILELIPFDPNAVTVKRDNRWKLTYEVRADDGSMQGFPAETIWHVKGPSWSGWLGLEAVKLAREAIGLAMATEESTGSLHKNSVRPSGMYSVDGTLNKDQYKALSDWVYEQFSGSKNAGKPMILDRAAKWSTTQMTGVDAQSLETRKYQVEEICRFTRVNPIMVFAESKNTTYASAEQQFLSHVVHCLAPWYTRIEQSANMHLLTEKERADGYYMNFVEEGLLRGSAVDTMNVLLGYVNGGLMTPNEGRSKLDANPIDGGDTLRVPENIVGAQGSAP